MPLPATESFTNSNGVQLTAHSSSWTLNDGDFDIQTNAFANDEETNETHVAHWNADVFNDDQYSQIVVSSISVDAHYIGASVRCAAAADTHYSIVERSDVNQGFLTRILAGVPTTIVANVGDGLSVSDELRLEVLGTTLAPYLNDVLHAMGEQTDSAIASGYAGIAGWGWTSGNRLVNRGDDWEGGNLAVDSFIPLTRRLKHKQTHLLVR